MDAWKIDDNHYYCPGCNATLVFVKEPYHIHHVIAWTDGGLTEAWNLMPMCEACHAVVHYGQGERAKKMRRRLSLLMQYQYGPLFLLQKQKYVNLLREEIKDQEFHVSDFRRIDDEISHLAFDAYMQMSGWSVSSETNKSTNLNVTTYVPPNRGL